MNNTTDILDPIISEYLDFLNDVDVQGEYILTPKKVDAHFQEIGTYLNYFLCYPDIFLDILVPVDSEFGLDPDQRIALRSLSRNRRTYMVATRGASKSFLAFASRYLTSMMIPRHDSFVCADIKRQAMDIANEKVIDDLWIKFPLLKNEMIKIPQPGKRPKDPYKSSMDAVEFNFSGGGCFDVVGVDSARGKRRHSGILEEVIEQNAVKLNEKIIPLMNIPRKDSKGRLVPTEPQAVQNYVTTAGYHGTFAYDKFIETLCLTAIDPDNFMTIAMSYKVPLKMGRITPEQIREIKSSTTFSQESFDREYNSRWSGNIKGAAFDAKTVLTTRKIVRAEFGHVTLENTNDFYIITADMAKDGKANTAAAVIRVSPRDFNFVYQIVNAFKIEDNDYEKVANKLKKAVIQYDAKMLCYDANGIGASLRDWLNKDTVDENGEHVLGLGIMNPPNTAEKDLIKYSASRTVCYEIKATGALNGIINRLFFSRLKSGSVRMLIPTTAALEKYKTVGKFATASLQKQKELLLPYQMTDIIQEELLNLDVIEVNDTGTPTLKVQRRNSEIQKDFFSAISYGIYAANTEFELKYYKRKQRRTQNLKDFVLWKA